MNNIFDIERKLLAQQRYHYPNKYNNYSFPLIKLIQYLQISLNKGMIKFMILSFFALFFCTFDYGTCGEVDKRLHQECIYPTVYVGRADGKGQGSAVIVRSDKIKDDLYYNVFISCAHVVDQKVIDYEVKQYLYDNWSQIKDTKSYPAIFTAVNPDQDTAIGVFYSDKLMPVATINFDPEIYIGNDVFRIGCGLGDEPRLDYGKLTLYRKLPKQIFRTSVMTVPGDSGSPLFHDYKVIGIAVSIRSFRNSPIFNISYSVPMDRFRQWSKSYNDGLNYAWDTSKRLPQMPFHYLAFKEYNIK